jgi:hypothetical protein
VEATTTRSSLEEAYYDMARREHGYDLGDGSPG